MLKTKRILFIQTTIDDPKTVPYWGYFRAEPAACWIVSAIGDPQWQSEIIDADWQTDTDVLRQAAKFSPDVVGFSCYTAGYPRALRLAAEIKRLDRNVFCIFGGWHPSLVPDEVLREPRVDAVAVGQGETIINHFLRDTESFRGHIIRADSYPPVERQQPFRKAEKPFAIFQVPGAPPLEEQRSASLVLSSGGCTFRCSYCCTPSIYGKGLPRRLDLIISEIKNLVEDHNINFIMIRDENPPIYKLFLHQFCDAIISAGLNHLVRFYSFGDTRLMTRDLLQKMASAGWIGLDYGVESFDPNQLRLLRRSPDLIQIKNVFRWTQEAGIFTTANVILWQPGDNVDCFERTEEALHWLQPDQVYPLFFAPFPGTDGARQCSGISKRTPRLEDYHLMIPIMENDPKIKTEDILSLKAKLLVSYYHSTEYADLIRFRKQQFGNDFWSLTKIRRDRLLKYGIDIWNLHSTSMIRQQTSLSENQGLIQIQKALTAESR
jgi:anaerobic magnesium-protoporphyrin IX monomethyl ester cyclase